MRHPLRAKALVLAACAGLAACASEAPPDFPPPNLQVQSPPPPPVSAITVADRLTTERYVRTVFIRLATANADLCGRHVMAEFGIRFANLDSVGPQMRQAAAASGLLSDRPVVFFAGAGLPAAEAGIAVGDELTGIEGRDLVPGEPAARSFADSATRAVRRNGAVAFRFRRGTQSFEAALAPVASCAVNVYLDVMPLPNAFTNGEDVLILTGLLDEVRSESELAVVIGHELGHVLQSQRGDAADADPVAAEIEADRLGLYLAARAGYDISNATAVMERIAQDYPVMAAGGEHHPSSTVRIAAMIETEREIAAKRKTGLPLLPDAPGS